MEEKPVIEVVEAPEVDTAPDFIRKLTEPLSKRGWPKWLVYLLAAFSFVYVLNPGLGVFELLPDNLPIVGNLDEGVAFTLILTGLVQFINDRRKK